MKSFKKALAALAVAAASGAAFAVPQTIGGITWDPDAAIDFKMEFSFAQAFGPGNLSPYFTELSGYGEVFKLNGNSILQSSNTGGGAGSFAVGRELTFELYGVNLSNPSPVAFTGGFLNLYSSVVNAGNNYDVDVNAFDAARATDTDLGQAWLRLQAVSSQFVTNSPDVNNPLQSGQLTVQWNVVGGYAASAFDNEFFITSDVRTRASAEFVDGVASGNGTFTSDTSQVVPEPGSLALLGLGLVGLAAIRRRKAA